MAKKPAAYTDKELKIACLDGEPEAQRYLYESFAGYVYTICRKYFIPPDYHKDMMQEIFSEVFMKLQNFKPEKGTLKTWIRNVSVHRVIDYKRKAGRIRDLENSAEFVESDEPVIWRQLYLEDFLKTIEPMPDGYRTVFLLSVSKGYSHEEIGKMLDISKETSRSQLSRAKNWLRKNIGFSEINNS